MSSIDQLLQNTWIYQELKQRIEEEIKQQHLSDLREVLQQIVQVRFPHLWSLTKETVDSISDQQELHQLIIQVSGAPNEKVARKRLLSRRGQDEGMDER
ncbi:MAG TPA: hypothetical protein VKR06_25085 [Ktedonosporobacter sp.]|nr:hypothetical protein [Ktedonosporobacter sp.]